MKKLTVCILILAMLLSFSACAAAVQPITNAEDVENLKKEVAGAWAKKNKIDEEKLLSFYYYGTDNGYHIICFEPINPGGAQLTGMHDVKIAECEFIYNYGVQLAAYRNGRFINLRTAYRLGLVSEETIAKAAELHAARKNAIE